MQAGAAVKWSVGDDSYGCCFTSFVLQGGRGANK